MLLDLYARPDDANFTPLRTAPVTSGEAFDAAFAAARAPDGMFYYGQAIHDRYAQAIELHRNATGEVLQNPYAGPPAVRPGRSLEENNANARAYQQWATDDAKWQRRRAVDERLLASRETTGGVVPDPRGFDDEIAREAVRLRTEAARAGDEAPVGAFFGAAAGELAHPINLATLPLGAGPVTTTARGVLAAAATRIGKTAATEAAIAGGSTAAIEGLDLLTRQQLGTLPTGGEVATNIAIAAAGGAILGGTLRGLVEAVGRVGSQATRIERDAVRVGEEQLAAQAARPAAVAPDVHAANVSQALQAVQSGERPQPRLDMADGAAATERLYTPSGRAVDVRYEAVELDSLIASNRAADLAVNPAYPADLQPRDRTRAGSEVQIAEIAGRLEPDRLARGGTDTATGAPLIGPDNVVESGNGRVLALARVYDGNPERATAYRSMVEAADPSASGLQRPVLVRRRVTPLTEGERVALTRESNESATARLLPSEQAMADARLLDGKLGLLADGAMDSAANRPFRDSFIRELSTNERSTLLTGDGELNPDGLQRIRRALVARAYGDPDLVARIADTGSEDMKAIGAALTEAAPAWARMREAAAAGGINPEMDRTADLLAALRLVQRARADGVPVSLLAGQMDMFDLTDTSRALLGVFFKDAAKTKAASARAMADRLLAYADEAMKSRPGPDLFGAPPASPLDVLDATGRRAAEAEQAAALTQQGAQKQAQDAAALDAERVVKSYETRIMVADANGNMVERPAADVLAEAEAELNAARTIEGCAYGAI